MSSPTAFDDTQFDLDLSDHLDQFPDPVVPSADDRDAGDLASDVVLGVVPVGDPWGVPAVAEPPAVTTAAAAEPAAATTVEDVPVPWAPAAGGTTTYDAAAVARAVDPPTSVHSVFAVTPPQGTPVVVPPPVPPAPPAGPGARSRRPARRRRGALAVLALALAAALVAGGAALAIVTDDDGADGATASSPGQTVTLPPAGAQADKPDDADEVAPAVPEVPDAAGEAPAAGDPADLERAADTVDAFLAVRGTDDERAVSSQGGRAELDAAIAAVGRAVPQGDPACSAGAAAGTFTCVLDTDRGPLTFTVGPDADDPQTSGFEVIGASVG